MSDYKTKRKEDKNYVIKESDFNTGYENEKYTHSHLLGVVSNEENYFQYVEDYNKFLESEDCYD